MSPTCLGHTSGHLQGGASAQKICNAFFVMPLPEDGQKGGQNL